MAEFTVYAGSASGWDSSSDATGAPNASWAYESSTLNDTKYLILGDFGILTELPANAIVNSLAIAAYIKGQHYSAMSKTVTARLAAYIDSSVQTPEEVAFYFASPATLSNTYTSGASVDPANLTDALFKVRLTASFTNMDGTALKAECDYVAVTVNYSLPGVGLEMGCNF